MDVFKITMIGVTGCMMAILFTSDKKEYAIGIIFCVGILISFAFITQMNILIQTFWIIADSVHVERKILMSLFKMIGITYLSEFSSSLCADAGFQSIAIQIQMFCKIVILSMSAPLLLSLLNSIGELLI